MTDHKYITNVSKPLIEQVQCVKETQHYAWIKRKLFNRDCVDRIKKDSRVFDSWEQAHAHLLQKAKDDVTTAKLRLQKAKGHLGNIQGLKPPTDESTDG